MFTRLSIVGAGEVGATIAFTAAMRGLSKEIVLIDKNAAKAKAQADDIMHGSMFLPPVVVMAGSMSDCRGSQVVVVPAGAKQAPGETRLQLAAQNVAMVQKIVPDILNEAPEAILLMVSNPVDVLTYAARKVSGGIASERIIGSGTVLDTSRFRSLLAQRLNVAVSNVHAYIVGEHGDSEVPLWSSGHVGNVPLNHFHTDTCALLTEADRDEIFHGVRNAAASVIAAKGATNWAVGLAVVRILQAIARDDQSILTVSRFLQDYHGISDVCLSVPGIMTGRGLGPLLPIEYSPVEIEALRRSASILRDVAQNLGCL